MPFGSFWMVKSIIFFNIAHKKLIFLKKAKYPLTLLFKNQYHKYHGSIIVNIDITVRKSFQH